MNTPENMTKKRVIYFILNGFFAYMLYLGIMNNNENAMNVALGLTWLTVACATLIFLFRNNDTLKAEMAKNKRSMPAWFDMSFDIAIACILAYAGYAFVATLYILQIIVMYNFWIEVQKFKAIKLQEQNIADESKNGIKF